MGTVQISARIDEALKNDIDEYCKSRGIVLNRFVRAALIDRLEELEDIEDLRIDSARTDPHHAGRRTFRPELLSPGAACRICHVNDKCLRLDFQPGISLEGF